ncbi:hypothetical protein HA402_015190 [Bradysia odoriphaga]|nr:hypothetical protein HA402_015190 [Bradysia odoriphaga]
MQIFKVALLVAAAVFAVLVGAQAEPIRDILGNVYGDVIDNSHTCGHCPPITGSTPTTAITLYPDNDFNAGPNSQPLTLQMQKNQCYELSGNYDKTLSNIKINGACVNLYSNHGCTGSVLKVDNNFPCPKSNTNVITFDCHARIAAGGQVYNDVTSSLRLC